MREEEGENIEGRKIFKQHYSLVVTLPRWLETKPGDKIIFKRINELEAFLKVLKKGG
ncbi:MAG: hypothetical protein QW724_00300 [Nitrososphaerota archaeon]